MRSTCVAGVESTEAGTKEMTMNKTLKVTGLIASFLAIASIGIATTTAMPNGYTLTATGDTFGAGSSTPRPKVKEIRVVTIAGAKSFILKPNVSGAAKVWEHYNLRDDSNTTLTASTTATTTIRFTEGVVIPQAGMALTTDDTSCSVYIVTDKDDN